MDDKRRLGMVETKTLDVDDGRTLGTRWRYQVDNHLGSSSLEIDQEGSVISYEEYHPFGSTAFHVADGNAEVSAKRFRYTGKEKDEETGLYYHGARYYAPWLGRWTAADPAGMVDGPNLYAYVSGNPAKFEDPEGTEKRNDQCVTEYAAHYLTERNHQGLGNQLIKARASPENDNGHTQVYCHQRLGGVLKYYSKTPQKWVG